MQKNDDKGAEVTSVTIFEREYPLQSHESPEYTRKVAELVDRKMAEIASRRNLADPTRVAIMAAMEIADQLLRNRTRRETNSRRTAQAVARLGAFIDDTDGREDGQAGRR